MSYVEDINRELQFQPKRLGAMITNGTAAGQVVVPWNDVPNLVRMLLRWGNGREEGPELWHAIVLMLAASNPIISDASGFDYCGLCGSAETYAGMLRHEDDCPYLQALQVRQAEAEERDSVIP